MRIACLWVPDFPLQALRRSLPELAETLLAAAAGPSPRDTLVAVSAEAAEWGVRPGMTVAQARGFAPEILVRVAPPAVTAAAEEALTDAANAFSPRIHRAHPGEVWLDVTGLERRIGNEPAIATALLRACHRIGLQACVGIASSVGVARVAARCAAAGEGASRRDAGCTPAERGGHGGAGGSGGSEGGCRPPRAGSARVAARCAAETRGEERSEGGIRSSPGEMVIPTGGERVFLAPLPLSLLEPDPVMAAALARWGVRTAGELARLPRIEVGLRLGPASVTLHRLACGEESAAFIPDPVPETLREGVVLEGPIGALEPFLFILHGLLGRFAARLELRGEGFAELLIELHLEGGERRDVRIALVAPTQEVPTVLALTRLELEAHPPGGPVDGVTALVVPGRVKLTQASLFGPRMPAAGKLAMTLARLAALVGPERLGAPAVPDTHRPGAWSLVPFCPPPPPAADLGGRQSEPRPPILRAFRPPRDAHVVVAGEHPVAARAGELGGVVVAWAGPYRFVGEWWGEKPYARDDFDVATSDGSLLRLTFDRLRRQWFADGVYD
ncbi:MAG: DNA polymerase Y family protein [Acidobacteriota bacterium]